MRRLLPGLTAGACDTVRWISLAGLPWIRLAGPGWIRFGDPQVDLIARSVTAGSRVGRSLGRKGLGRLQSEHH